MADLLIPLLLLFLIVAGVLVAALVHQLRDLGEGSGRPFGGWHDGGPDPELPWRRERADRPGSGPGQRQPATGRPTLPWQRREQQVTPARPQPTRAAPAPPPTRSVPPPQTARPEPSPQPARREPEPQPAAPSLPWQRGREQAGRERRRRPRQPSWLTLPGERRAKDPARERAQPAARPQPGMRAQRDTSPEPPAQSSRRPRGDAAEEPPAPGRSSGRCCTCGGTGQAIVSRSGGGLGRGPCPVCQG